MREIIPNILYKIKNKYFETTNISLDEPACMNCHQRIRDIPLRLFFGKVETGGKGEIRELDFCMPCAKELGVLPK